MGGFSLLGNEEQVSLCENKGSSASDDGFLDDIGDYAMLVGPVFRELYL